MILRGEKVSAFSGDLYRYLLFRAIARKGAEIPTERDGEVLE